MFKRLKERRAVNARREAAGKRMRAEHAAGILYWLVKRPEGAADVRLVALVDSAVGKLTDSAFNFDDARDCLYAAAGHAKGAGNSVWSAAAYDAITVLESSRGYDPGLRRMHEPGSQFFSLEAMAAQEMLRSVAVPTAPPVRRAKTDSPRRTHVYVIRSSSSKLVKIGYAVNPDQRVRELQTGSPGKLTVAWSIPGRERLERELHRRFAEHRKSGEWFDLTQLGDAVTVVREEVDRIRKEVTDKGVASRYFYDEQGSP